MSTHPLIEEIVSTFKAQGRIVIVGASLAGLRAAEALRDEGFAGSLTIIGDEVHEPYDRPPLSKQVLKGWVPAGNTKLPRLREVDADWRLGVAATGLDRDNREVLLANGDKVPYDRLLIATGVRSRAWFNPEEAKLKGLYTLRTSDDAEKIQAAFKAKPKRVLIVGAGFIGSEMASVCRDLEFDVTVAERSSAPLVGPLGGVIGDIAAKMQRDAGVTCGPGSRSRPSRRRRRTRPARQALRRHHARRRRGGGVARVRAQHRMARGRRPGQRILGSGLRRGLSRLRHQRRGDRQHLRRRRHRAGAARALRVPVHGDRARRCRSAGRSDRRAQHGQCRKGRRPHLPLPQFWSGQFGVNIKGVGVCSFGDEIVFTQGSVEDLRFAAAFGKNGRIVGALTFNHGKWLEYYGRLIEQSAPFPPPPPGYDAPSNSEVMSARFGDPRAPTGIPEVVLTGHDPTSRGAEFRVKSR